MAIDDYASYAPPRSADRVLGFAVYISYLIGAGAALFVFLGAIAAFVRAPAAGSFWRSHFRYQKRGFILWAVASLFLAVTGFFIFGVLGGRAILLPSLWGLMAFMVFIWWVARNVIGLMRAVDGRPVANPDTLGLP